MSIRFYLEHPENDENVMIWNDERIKRGLKEDFMKGDQDFFIYIEKEKEKDMDKGCKTIVNEYFPGRKSARGNGYGPGGKFDYSNGDTYKPSINSQCRRFYYIERRNCTEKPRTGSFHRSKTFQKNGLAPSAPKSSTSISLILEPDEQVENIPSANGMASAFIQIQELHQEINPNVIRRANYARGTRKVTTQEDNLTPTVNCMSSEMTTEWMRACRKSGCRTCRIRPIGSLRKRTAAVAKPNSTTCLRKYDSRIGKKTKSEGSVQICSFIHSVVLQKDFPILTPPYEKVKLPPKQDSPFVPIHRKWFVYSVTDTKSIQTTRQEPSSAGSNARNTEESGIKSECKKSKTGQIKCPASVKKAKEESPSVTLKEIINLLRTIFHQSSDKVPENKGSGLTFRKDADNRFAMSHCLERLMEEKKNYLNLEKTKKLRKAQEANFISDSFNFFNLLNKEFLSLKSPNPRIEELRNVITQKKEPEMEEYLDLYKKVIRVSLTEPEQYLMDKAKQELERYTDMYYDLMKCICLEKESKDGTSFPSAKSSEKRCSNINYGKILKSKVSKDTKTWDKHYGKKKTQTEKSHQAKTVDCVTNRASGIGRSSYRTNNIKKNEGVPRVHAKDHNMNDLKMKPVVGLLSLQKSKESQQDSGERKNPEEEKEDPSSKGKIFLALSLCDDGLLKNHAEDGYKALSEGKNKGKTSLLPEDDKHESFEALPESSDIQDSLSGCVRADSDVTVYPKSSIYEEESSENQVEESMLKSKAFRKILSEQLQHFTVFYEAELEDKRQRYKGELENKSLHKNITTPTNDIKRGLDNTKSSRKRKCGTNPSIYQMREERIRENSYKKRSSCFPKSVSSNEREDTAKKVPWWRNDNFPASNSGANRVRKSYQVRKTENYKSMKTTWPKMTKETGLREDKKKRKIEMHDKIEEEPLKSSPEFVTPSESYFEWQFGLKDLEELLQDIPSKTPSLGEMSKGKLVCPDEEEERELRKLSLSGRDENGDGASVKQEPSVSIGRKTSLKLGFHNPLKAEWTEEPLLMDYQKIAEVLNQFLGSVAEVWKAAAGLKDLLQPATSKMENLQSPQTPGPKEDAGAQVLNNRKTIESFKSFLRILTVIFEDGREEVIRKQLSLLKKEFIEHSHEPPDSASQCESSERTRFVQEIAEIPREMREMIANELISSGRETENMEPALFLVAVKKVGEKLKESYSWDEYESQNGEEISECCQPQKIYYRPAKKPSQEGKEESVIKSNLGNLAEKIRKLCREKTVQESTNDKQSFKNNGSLETRSSVYFDAADTVLQPDDTPRSRERSDADNIDKVTLSPIDESYFSLNANNFEKYRSLIYDKIITFLRSDNPMKINYGIALLSKMIDRDSSSHVKTEKKPFGAKDEREGKWQDLLDKLMETCQVIETEIKAEVEKCAGREDNEKKMEIGKACEYVKSYVDRMKSLIKEMKSSHGQYLPDDPIQRIKALENSRETNKERQLLSPDTKFSVRQKYFLDNAMDFINSIGKIGYTFDKFPFFPKCFGRSGSEKNTGSEMDEFRNEVSNELLLEGNKTMVKSLRKNIEKRQRKIQGMIEECGKGMTQGESLLGEKITRKVRDLKKYYLLLEKMICDPTLLPPKWLKLEGSEQKGGKDEKPTRKEESSVMTMLEDLMKQASAEQRTLKYSRSTNSADSRNAEFRTPASVGSLTLIKIKCETLNVERPALSKGDDATKEAEEAMENGVPLRPITA